MATRQAGTTHILRGLETGGSRWSGNMEPLNLPKRLQAPLSPRTDSLMPLGENQIKTSLPGSEGSTAMLKETPAGDDELRRPPWQAKANHVSFRERDAKAADGVLM